MATDLKWMKTKTEEDLRLYLERNDIDAADVISLYLSSNNMACVWYKTGAADVTGPRLVHTTIANGKTAGIRIPVYVQSPAESEASFIRLYYRTTGDPAYIGPLEMKVQGDGITWLSYIEAGKVQAPSVDYYIYSEDSDANSTSLGNAGAPLQFTVV